MDLDKADGNSFPFSAPLDDVSSYVNCPVDILERNILENAGSGIPFLVDSKYEKRSEPLAIVGGGPSLLDTKKELNHFKHIMVCSSAHDYVIENRIFPDFAMFCDAMPNASIYFKNKRRYCTYLIASQCDPSLLKHLSTERVRLWDSNGGVDEKVFAGRNRVVGGSSSALRTPALAALLGFDDLHFFGVDSSFHKDRFAYPDDTDTAEEIMIGFEGKQFRSTLHLVAQAQDFQKFLSNYGHRFSVTVHGDSLFAAVWKDMRRKADALIKRENAA